MADTTDTYRQNVQNHIEVLVPIFARAAIGDFSQDLKIPDTENEFTSLYAGIQIMLDVIREKIAGLEQSNRQLQERVEEKIALLQSIGDGVVVLDTQKNITFLNKSAEYLIGWKENEVIGKSWVDLVPLQLLDGTPADPSMRPMSVPLLTDDPASAQVVYYFVRKDQSRFPVNVTIAPVVFDGDKIGTIVVFRDVSKEKQIEQLRDDFLSLATHQLRNPLTNMRWALDSLLTLPEAEISESLRKKLENVYKNNLHMIELVNDILSVSRMSQGRLNEQAQPHSIPKLIDEIVSKLELEARHAQVTLHVQIHGQNIGQTQYVVDGSLFSHCIENVISNAIKYSKRNGNVYITLEERSGEVCLDVRDQGVGIPEGDKPHIFERFYRGRNVSQMDVPGSGLGLFVVHSLVERWGGKILFDSQEDKGTLVTVCIPLPKADTQKKGDV